MRTMVLGDNFEVPQTPPDSIARLVYVDPACGTGTSRARTSVRAVCDVSHHAGCKGRRYRTEHILCSACDYRYETIVGNARWEGT